uniref:Diphthamide biosynthesis protein 3 n=1 Tax=Arcella intermedia TaxID=1963864 RepID=A0A6B2LUZ5_9EUKA
MTSFYEEVSIDDMEFDEDQQIFFYQCPCGDKFQLSMSEILSGNDIAKCPSCSLLLKVLYDPEDFVEESGEEPPQQLKEPIVV